ncbi:MAG: hypothetical protein Q7R22_005300 [Verrucomicrobiota bacterium JB025]|nr:hypothetical protein [Verrucomicrobiota bacterium JB025]
METTNPRLDNTRWSLAFCFIFSHFMSSQARASGFPLSSLRRFVAVSRSWKCSMFCWWLGMAMLADGLQCFMGTDLAHDNVILIILRHAGMSVRVRPAGPAARRTNGVLAIAPATQPAHGAETGNQSTS